MMWAMCGCKMASDQSGEKWLFGRCLLASVFALDFVKAHAYQARPTILF
jgi:hypothetical protein